MKFGVFVLCVAAVVALCGCGGKKGAEGQVPLPVQYGDSIRQSINELDSGEPGSLPGNVTGFVENLDGYKSSDFGDASGTFEEIKTKAGELQTLVESKASQADIKKKIAELKELADKLPKGEGSDAGKKKS